MDTPSMVHRSGDTLIVRSVVSGNQIYLGDGETGPNELENSIEESIDSSEEVCIAISYYYKKLGSNISLFKLQMVSQSNRFIERQERKNIFSNLKISMTDVNFLFYFV